MSNDWYGAKSGPGERWNVNLPALIGVVFVFLLGVIVWVIVDARRTDDPDARPGLTGSTLAVAPGSTATTSTPLVVPTVPPTSSPIPLPVTTVVATAPPAPTLPPTAPPTAATTAPPATEAPLAPTTLQPTTVPLPTAAPEQGDLGVPGHPIQRPPCDASAITILGAAIGGEASPGGLASFMDRYPGSNYLRTDQTCRSLTQSKNGEPIYIVYFGPFPLAQDACTARAGGPADSYVRTLSNDLNSGNSTVTCR